MDAIPSATRVPELECKFHTLQIELNTLSAQLSLLQRDRTCMIAEIKELKLRLRNMEQQVHLQRDGFFALHDAMWDQRLKLVTGQALPNQKSDISISSGCEPVAAVANPRSAATLLRANSRRTSIDPLKFISLETFGGISLSEQGPRDFEFIMDSAINCCFDGSHLPEAWNCVTPTVIIIDGGPIRTPTSNNEGEIYPKEGTGLSTNGVRNSSPMSLAFNAKSAATKDEYVLKSDGATPLPSYLNSIEISDEVRSLVLDEGNESRQQEFLGYWEKCCIIDGLVQSSS